MDGRLEEPTIAHVQAATKTADVVDDLVIGPIAIEEAFSALLDALG